MSNKDNNQKKNFIDAFEYKGQDIKVYEDEEGEKYFHIFNKGNESIVPFSKLKEFINGPFEHFSLNTATLDKIRESVKIDFLLIDLRDLKKKLEKYS